MFYHRFHRQIFHINSPADNDAIQVNQSQFSKENSCFLTNSHEKKYVNF